MNSKNAALVSNLIAAKPSLSLNQRNDGDSVATHSFSIARNDRSAMQTIQLDNSTPISTISATNILNTRTETPVTIVQNTAKLLPYQYVPHINAKDRCLMFMMVPVLPLRILGILTALLVGYIVARVTLLCTKTPLEEWTSHGPLTGWQVWCQRFMRRVGRLMFFFIGIYRIEITGDDLKQLNSKDTPVIVVAPHVAYADCLISTIVDCSPVARAEVRDIPIFGLCTTILQPIYVDREDVVSRQSTAEIIANRCSTEIGRWPPVLIFPEGTTSNGTCLYKFKAGAFIPQKPVQMLTITYRTWMSSFNPMITTWEMGMPTWQVLVRILLQPKVTAVVENMGVYQPSVNEMMNPYIYTRNMQQHYADHLKLPKTDLSYRDARLFMDDKRGVAPVVRTVNRTEQKGTT